MGTLIASTHTQKQKQNKNTNTKQNHKTKTQSNCCCYCYWSYCFYCVFFGGYNPLYFNTIPYLGAKPYEFSLSNVYTTRLDAQWQFLNKTYLISSINYAEAELPFKYIPNQDFSNKLGNLHRRFSFGLGIAYNSPLGPISFSVARDINKSQFTTNFSLGFWYK